MRADSTLERATQLAAGRAGRLGELGPACAAPGKLRCSCAAAGASPESWCRRMIRFTICWAYWRVNEEIRRRPSSSSAMQCRSTHTTCALSICWRKKLSGRATPTAKLNFSNCWRGSWPNSQATLPLCWSLGGWRQSAARPRRCTPWWHSLAHAPRPGRRKCNRSGLLCRLPLLGPIRGRPRFALRFLRNSLMRVPDFRQSLGVIQPTAGNDAPPFTHFLLLPSPTFSPAPGGHGDQLPGCARDKSRLCAGSRKRTHGAGSEPSR